MAVAFGNGTFQRDGQSDEIPPLWKSYLYQLQQQAPVPKRVICLKQIDNRPSHYGREYHGMISREEANSLLHEDGSYLVRESQRAPCQFTLSMRFNGTTKNFRLYFDGQHYVGEKRFDTIQDLVADGLITLYMEKNAGDYIASMCMQSKYEESPYMTLSTYRHRIKQLHRSSRSSMKRKSSTLMLFEDRGSRNSTIRQSIIEDKPVSPVADENSDVQHYEKPHVFKTQNFIGLPWCDFCGNFMWGLIGQGVKCEDCGFSAHRRCSEKVPNDCLPALKYVKRAFGVDLTTLVKARNTLRPFVVDMCIQEIERRGIDAEGLYRVSGFSDEVDALRLAFDRDSELADISPAIYEDIHVIAGVLKLFLRLLPIPVITYETYPLFMNAVKQTSLELKLQALREAVSKLPPAHFQTLKYLMAHLNRVSERHHINLMTSNNLSTVFCPTLMRSTDLALSMDPFTAWQLESAAIELLITYSGKIFDR